MNEFDARKATPTIKPNETIHINKISAEWNMKIRKIHKNKNTQSLAYQIEKNTQRESKSVFGKNSEWENSKIQLALQF